MRNILNLKRLLQRSCRTEDERGCHANGQLKPAYNLQNGVDSEYVIWLGIYQNPTDTLTLNNVISDMKRGLRPDELII